jgi:competence protein CoiA
VERAVMLCAAVLCTYRLTCGLTACGGILKITAMFKALTDDAARMMVPPRETGDRAICPTCGGTVIAHVGRLVVAHWAHESRADCDEWSEPDTAWHLGWQEAAPWERREVTMGRHRADVVTYDGTVVELQHSYLGADMIAAREAFYGQGMAWLWDARDAVAGGRLQLRKRWRGRWAPGRAGGASFRWYWPRKSIAMCERPKLLDLGTGEVMSLVKFDAEPPAGGWGWLYEEAYVRWWLGWNV